MMMPITNLPNNHQLPLRQSIRGVPLDHQITSEANKTALTVQAATMQTVQATVQASFEQKLYSGIQGPSVMLNQTNLALQNLANSAAGSKDKNTKDRIDYLQQLLQDKKQVQVLPKPLVHVERLIDEEIVKVRSVLFQNGDKQPLELPVPQGPAITITEKVYVPVKDHPEYNFVGRLLGPRGLTAKQLEQETKCKIMVRGKGSMRDKKKEDSNRGKPNWEHLSDDLHVLITVEDTENRARVKMQRAIEEINKLLIPTEGEDDLKKKQLMELAIINGTYRDFSIPTTQNHHQFSSSQASIQFYADHQHQAARLVGCPPPPTVLQNHAAAAAAMRPQQVPGQPPLHGILNHQQILSRLPNGQVVSGFTHQQPHVITNGLTHAPPPVLAPSADGGSLLYYTTPFDYTQHSQQIASTNPFDYNLVDHSAILGKAHLHM